MGYYLKTFLGALLFLGSLVAFNYALVQLLQVGTCASGNTPYAISRPCPSGVGTDVALLTGSIFTGLIGAGIFAFRGDRPGHQTSLRDAFSWGTFAWGLFFAGTGATALIASLTDSDIHSSGGGKLGGMIVGVTFLLMGLPALAIALWGFFGKLGGRDKRPKGSGSGSGGGPAPTAEGGLLDTLRSSTQRAAGAGWSRLSPSSRGGGGGDNLDKIARLNKLRESGALTQAEFNREKAKLLAES